MFSFQHIEFLLGLILIVPLVLLFLNVLYWKKKVKKALGDEELIEGLTKQYSKSLFRLKFIFLAAAVVLLVFAGANLRKPATGDKEKRAGIDVMIALDVSKSMLSEDVKPSRLVKAKQLVSLMIDRLQDNRIGFVVFAGQAYLQMPLTSDAAAAKIFVSNASPDAVPMQGTVVSDALKLCDNSLDTKEKKYKAVILITDGEDHDTKTEQILQQLYDHGVIVHTVGVGTAEGSTIIDPVTGQAKRDNNGQTVISKLNEKELELIASKTGGTYHRLDNTVDAVNDITGVLDNMDKKLINGEGNERQYASFFPFFIAFALLVLLSELFIPETKKEKN
ncbi:VWA domain-containing protein [Danxiaibacter flavus]|uniref:VWA domain-containing protein n=1 Tax=Danxiaibacter flavus TaxID=3049108 RepID=A0ABV3Z8B9_9BACT|nr:VWA domain-containing protein [Chitinophagaceae bacterium DXS]